MTDGLLLEQKAAQGYNGEMTYEETNAPRWGMAQVYITECIHTA